VALASSVERLGVVRHPSYTEPPPRPSGHGPELGRRHLGTGGRRRSSSPRPSIASGCRRPDGASGRCCAKGSDRQHGPRFDRGSPSIGTSLPYRSGARSHRSVAPGCLFRDLCPFEARVLGTNVPCTCPTHLLHVGRNVLFVEASKGVRGREIQAPVCPVCQGPVVPLDGPGQPRRYCSSRCKSRAARRRRETGLATAAVPPIGRRVEPEAAACLGNDRPEWRDFAVAAVTSDPLLMLQCMSLVESKVGSRYADGAGWAVVSDQIRRLAGQIENGGVESGGPESDAPHPSNSTPSGFDQAGTSKQRRRRRGRR
jgi:hypothetical protein